MELEGTTVVVADDDRIVRRMVVSKLSGLGCEVSEAEEGREALDAIREELPELLITDQLMPGLNGLQLVREIRDDPALASLPVIMLTSKGSEQDVIEGLEAGLDDYVIKPFSPDELAARVRSVLWRTRRDSGG